MSILERIFSELEKQNIKPIRLCEHLGISTALLSTWKKRGTEPKAKYIKPIAEFLGVSENYLLTGEEDGPYYSDKETDELYNEMHENPDLRFLLSASKNLNSDDLRALADIAKRMRGTQE